MRNPVRPGPPKGPASKLEMFLGHYAGHIIAATIITVAVSDALKQPRGITGNLLSLPSAVAIMAVWCDFRQHTWRLCERCARSTPLDGHAAARRWRLALRLTHSKARFALVACLAALITWHSIAGKHVPWWYWMLDVIVFAVMAASYAAARLHNQLQPWCPQCNWGDGGDEEVSPDVPAPTVSA